MAKAITQEQAAQNGHVEGSSIVEQLRVRSQLRTEVVKNVPRWNMDVTVRELSAKEVSEIQSQFAGGKTVDTMEVTARLLAKALVEPALEYEDILYLLDGSSEPLDYIAGAIKKLNRIGERGLTETENSFPDTNK